MSIKQLVILKGFFQIFFFNCWINSGKWYNSVAILKFQKQNQYNRWGNNSICPLLICFLNPTEKLDYKECCSYSESTKWYEVLPTKLIFHVDNHSCTCYWFHCGGNTAEPFSNRKSLLWRKKIIIKITVLSAMADIQMIECSWELDGADNGDF